MNVWLVGIGDCESSEVKHVCKTEKLAVKKLFEERDELIKEWKRMIEFCKKENDKGGIKDYSDMIKKLSNNDYEHWDNYPHEIPFVFKMKLEEESKLKPPESDKDKTKKVK